MLLRSCATLLTVFFALYCTCNYKNDEKETHVATVATCIVLTSITDYSAEDLWYLEVSKWESESDADDH